MIVTEQVVLLPLSEELVDAAVVVGISEHIGEAAPTDAVLHEQH